MKKWCLLISFFMIFPSLCLCMQTQPLISDSGCVSYLESEDSSVSIVIPGLTTPLLEKTSCVYCDTVPEYTQFINTIDPPPVII